MDKKITLLCPTKGNSKTDTSVTDATCVEGTTFKVSNGNRDFKNILCDQKVKASTKTTKKACGGGEGYVIHLGFPIDKEFLTLIESCYDNQNGNVLYTSHTLHGKEMQYASKTKTRPSFSVDGLPSAVSDNIDAYKQKSEKSIFESLLGSSALASEYIYPNSYLARGHLAADADFLFAPWQFATYFFVNVVPQWQAINNGNWKKVEKMARETADSYAEDLKVYTGSHKVLELDDVGKKKRKIYLSGKLLPVPKFVWKILLSEKTQKAVAFISVNNPFIDKLDNSDVLCTDICNKYGWARDSWNNGTKGFIYCCDVKDFLNVIKTGPTIGNVDGVLKAPKIKN